MATPQPYNTSTLLISLVNAMASSHSYNTSTAAMGQTHDLANYLQEYLTNDHYE